MSRHVRREAPDDAYLRQLGIVDQELDSKQISVAEALTFLLHEIAFPGLLAVEQLNGVSGPQALTFNANLFAERPVSLFEPEGVEPYVVTIASEGAVTNIGGSRPYQDQQAIARVLVRSAARNHGMDLSWRLHRFFRKHPSLVRDVTVREGTASAANRVDLLLRKTHPLDEPGVAEEDSGRIVVSFRVNVTFSREL